MLQTLLCQFLLFHWVFNSQSYNARVRLGPGTLLQTEAEKQSDIWFFLFEHFIFFWVYLNLFSFISISCFD